MWIYIFQSRNHVAHKLLLTFIRFVWKVDRNTFHIQQHKKDFPVSTFRFCFRPKIFFLWNIWSRGLRRSAREYLRVVCPLKDALAALSVQSAAPPRRSWYRQCVGLGISVVGCYFSCFYPALRVEIRVSCDSFGGCFRASHREFMGYLISRLRISRQVCSLLVRLVIGIGWINFWLSHVFRKW